MVHSAHRLRDPAAVVVVSRYGHMQRAALHSLYKRGFALYILIYTTRRKMLQLAVDLNAFICINSQMLSRIYAVRGKIHINAAYSAQEYHHSKKTNDKANSDALETESRAVSATERLYI